ncbi:helix-turn-helix domain-containing protein [Burkholderia cepacia]|uniref:helix-turn-helix domain-containing protein n=2 Tax=Burkholderia cepacia TaxID=292 RepID=UPI00075C22E4|nr:hypothetical protein WK36_36415 [Burkholderia cepacia]
MDLIQRMQVFVTLADAGTFTETGKRLKLTTAYASRAIASLETHLGIQLLNRTTRSICLTGTARCACRAARRPPRRRRAAAPGTAGAAATTPLTRQPSPPAARQKTSPAPLRPRAHTRG